MRSACSWNSSAARRRPSAVTGGSFPFGGSTDQRGAQILGERQLAPVQPELREVVVHVRNRTRLGLRALARGGPPFDRGRFFLRVERLGHAIGPLQPRTRLVRPEPLEVRLAVRCTRRRVGLLRCLASRSRRPMDPVRRQGSSRPPQRRAGRSEDPPRREIDGACELSLLTRRRSSPRERTWKRRNQGLLASTLRDTS